MVAAAPTANDVAGLEKKIEQLTDIISNRATVEGRHFGEMSPVMSFFESGESHGTMAKSKFGRPFNRGGRVSMPKGYTRSEFNTFGDFVRLGMKDQHKFESQHSKAIASLAKTLNINTADFGDGGALVLPEFSPEIMRMLYESESLWGRTRQYTVAGNSMKFPRMRDQNRNDGQRHGGVLGYARKCPSAPRDLRWMWLFPSLSLSRDPADGRMKRYHCDDNHQRRIFRDAVLRSGVCRTITPHDLRRAAATHLHLSGMPLKRLQAILGHSSLDVTQLYILEDEAQINGFHSPFDLLCGVD